MLDSHGEKFRSDAFICPATDAGSPGEQPWHALSDAGFTALQPSVLASAFGRQILLLDMYSVSS